MSDLILSIAGLTKVYAGGTKALDNVDLSIRKGEIFALWAIVQSFVPILSGGFADRYGYKINIAAATHTGRSPTAELHILVPHAEPVRHAEHRVSPRDRTPGSG